MSYDVDARQISVALNTFLDVLHGDLKPENVVVSRDVSGSDKAELIDFGYSCYGSQEDDLVTMPFSPPWTAPEHEWKDFHMASAMRMDIYSLGMTCAYILFCEHWPKLLSRIQQADSTFTGDEAYISLYQSLEERFSVIDLFHDIMKDTAWSFDALPRNVVKFLECSLASNEQDRISNVSDLAYVFYGGRGEM